MQAYQKRVVEELAGLDEKRFRLSKFRGSEEFQKLTIGERDCLERQADAMRIYSEVLAERIAAFGVKVPSAEDEAAMTASEALYGFMAWLTTRKEAVTLGAKHDSAHAVRLVQTWMEVNGLPEPRPRSYPGNVVQPTAGEEPVAGADLRDTTCECGYCRFARYGQAGPEVEGPNQKSAPGEPVCAGERSTAELYSELLQATGDGAIGETPHETALRHIRCGVMYIRFGGNP